MLENGLTPRNTIVGRATYPGRVFGSILHTEPFSDRRRYLSTILGRGIRGNSTIFVHCRKPGKDKVPRVFCASRTVDDSGRLKGDVTLVASKEFSKTSANPIVKRYDPRTMSNNPVTLMRRNSLVRVSMVRQGLGVVKVTKRHGATRRVSRVLGREHGG